MEQQARAPTLTAESAPGRGHQGDAAGDQASEALNRSRFELLRCALYHDASVREIQRLNRIMTFGSIVLSSTAIAALGSAAPLLGQLSGAAVAMISAAQLVWDFSGRAARHEDLRRRFYSLLADLEAGEDGAVITSHMTRIFADEPPVNHRRNRRAHNQAGDNVYGPGNFERA